MTEYEVFFLENLKDDLEFQKFIYILSFEALVGTANKKAKEEGYDFFSTVLSISPMKNVNYINEIGEKYSKEYDIPFLFADFKVS